MNKFLKRITPSYLKKPIKNLILRNNYKGLKKSLSTSLSDNQVYPNFCMKASLDLRVFSNFRRNIVYKQILEHTTYEMGIEYYEELNKNNPTLLKQINIIKKNDDFGNPKIYEYPKIGKISPSTLRYTKIFGDILNLFKDLNDLNICEIGVGYGGQCRIINSLSNPSRYTLVDIKPALMLTQRYLDNFIMNSVLQYKTMNELEVKSYDLVISNYAFSELPRSIQDVYLKKIILNSKKGYITYNEINPEHFNSYKREELINIIPNSHIIEEKPLTNKKNCIIVWGDIL